MSERRNIYEEVYGQDNPEGESHGWIQWKGTDVCMDLYCLCGVQEHFDGDFFYSYQCSECGQRYAVGQNIKLIPLTDEQAGEYGPYKRGM